MDKEFEIGDEVVFCGILGSHHSTQLMNEKGIVKRIDLNYVLVEFYNFINGHDGNVFVYEKVHGKDGHCWNVRKPDLKITKKFNKIEDFILKPRFIG